MIIDNQKTLEVLLTGSTHYIATAPGKQAAIYYGTQSDAYMLAPDGKKLAGQWRLTPTGYHVDWTNGPSAGWKLDIAPGRIAYLDLDDVERGLVSSIVPGDAASLAAN